MGYIAEERPPYNVSPEDPEEGKLRHIDNARKRRDDAPLDTSKLTRKDGGFTMTQNCALEALEECAEKYKEAGLKFHKFAAIYFVAANEASRQYFDWADDTQRGNIFTASYSYLADRVGITRKAMIAYIKAMVSEHIIEEIDRSLCPTMEAGTDDTNVYFLPPFDHRKYKETTKKYQRPRRSKLDEKVFASVNTAPSKEVDITFTGVSVTPSKPEISPPASVNMTPSKTFAGVNTAPSKQLTGIPVTPSKAFAGVNMTPSNIPQSPAATGKKGSKDSTLKTLVKDSLKKMGETTDNNNIVLESDIKKDMARIHREVRTLFEKMGDKPDHWLQGRLKSTFLESGLKCDEFIALLNQIIAPWLKEYRRTGRKCENNSRNLTGAFKAGKDLPRFGLVEEGNERDEEETTTAAQAGNTTWESFDEEDGEEFVVVETFSPVGPEGEEGWQAPSEEQAALFQKVKSHTTGYLTALLKQIKEGQSRERVTQLTWQKVLTLKLVAVREGEWYAVLAAGKVKYNLSDEGDSVWQKEIQTQLGRKVGEVVIRFGKEEER